MAKVIFLEDKTDFAEFIRDLDKKKAQVTNFICIYTTHNERQPNRLVHYFWFGDDPCLTIRGMLKRMDDIIAKYMDEAEDYN